MGKASKWFRGLLGMRTPDSSSPSPNKPPKEKRRWSLVKSYREKDNHLVTAPVQGGNKHVLAELALTAATAATRLTGTAASGVTPREEWAAVKIQAAFRGCLARKALRALKGLVKLQALVRGHIERKRTKEWVQRVQALLRAQTRARTARGQILDQASFHIAKSFTGPLHGPVTPEKFESPISSESVKYSQSPALKRNISKSCGRINGNQEKCGGTRSDNRVDEQSWTHRKSWMRTCSMDDETSFRILDVDSGKPHIRSKRRNLFYSASQALLPDHYSQNLTTTTKDSTSSCEVGSRSSPLKMNEVEENSLSVASSYQDGSLKKSPLITPTKSDGSRSNLSGYTADSYPSYMAYTESSKAKLRSLSAPKQRAPRYERSSSSKLATQRIAALRASFTSKDYPGSGRLDKLGLPVGYSF